MFKSIRSARDQVEAQATSCVLHRNAYHACKYETKSRVQDELARPGTLLGAFALGAMLGRGKKGVTNSPIPEHNGVGNDELKRALSGVQTEVEEVLERIAALGEAGGGEPRAQSGENPDVGETVSALAMSVVTRVIASLAIEKVGEMRSSGVKTSSSDSGNMESDIV